LALLSDGDKYKDSPLIRTLVQESIDEVTMEDKENEDKNNKNGVENNEI